MKALAYALGVLIIVCLIISLAMSPAGGSGVDGRVLLCFVIFCICLISTYLEEKD